MCPCLTHAQRDTCPFIWRQVYGDREPLQNCRQHPVQTQNSHTSSWITLLAFSLLPASALPATISHILSMKAEFPLRKQIRSWYHNVCTLSIITHLHSEVSPKYWAWSWKACVIPSTVPRMLPTWLWTPSSSSLWVFSNVTLLPRTHGSVLPVPPFLHIILPSPLLFLSHLFIRVSHTSTLCCFVSIQDTEQKGYEATLRCIAVC